MPLLPAEGQGQRVHINTHTLSSINLYLLSPRSRNLCFFFLAEKIHSSPEKKSAPEPCHESADQGKLLLALVGPESHDFNLVMGVTSGIRTFDAVADSGALSVAERGSTPPTPHPPLPFPSRHASLSGCSRCCSEYNHRGALCRITKHSRCYKTFFFDKTVIIIIILYNTVPVRIHSKSLHVPQLLRLSIW